MIGAGLIAKKVVTSKWTWIILAAAIAYGYWSYLTSEIKTLEANNTVLTLAKAEQDKAIAQMRKDIVKKDEAQKRLRDKEVMYQSNITRLNKKLTESKNKKPRDLSKLAKNKPKMMEKIINRGAKFRNRCFEIASGSPILPEELTVPKKDRNNVCPEVFAYEN